ncbi:Type II secretion system protein [Rubrivivax sp. A210]|uniref:type II secretion system protein n=1 Tax=Rubrivivax sp. A210 TaxID=2772301 RepID=UPI0019184837|nr:type II secretion system protein [Rubrivivax sp. A210]CAD5373341.1 Type II secretion system protein [Rubrivivax sp. A210]
MSRRRGQGERERGMVLMGVLVALALAALLAAQAGQRLADTRQREAEEELLFVGDQYRRAIESYWLQSPGGRRNLPRRVDDLLNDTRFPVPRRHLRKAWADPLEPGRPWGLVRQGEGLVGVYSEAPGTPFRQAGPELGLPGFEGASRYADWRFLAQLGPVPGAGSASSAGAPASPLPPAPRPTR